MSRRKRKLNRDIKSDPRFKSESLAKFMNLVMVSGKKSIAEKIVYGAIDILNEKMKRTDSAIAQHEAPNETMKNNSVAPLVYFEKAVDNVRPSVEVKSRRVGGATYQVPVEVRSSRSRTLGMRWIINAARVRHEKTMQEKLAAELFDACMRKGGAVKKQEDTHKMAKANQAFTHFRLN